MEEKRRTVENLYDGIADGTPEKVAALLEPDVEWWFHGPPGREHMMRVLTGVEEEHHRRFKFRPRRVEEVGKWVVAEGWEAGDDAYWVHVWAVEGGVITQFREYFNTRITVRELEARAPAPAEGQTAACFVGGKIAVCPAMWVSREWEEGLGRPLPWLVLAI
ncbi:Wound-induced protein 1 [Apostasia shenzhenica]|uniref:Wound-induced protein 1 n=1 Tax=Apostasia shenzhenica TaxID=1088818 RepID=A0A2I0BH58_9ASPA|nr:Wound-induced protein 1 [Apostasia shenzhenica]